MSVRKLTRVTEGLLLPLCTTGWTGAVFKFSPEPWWAAGSFYSVCWSSSGGTAQCAHIWNYWHWPAVWWTATYTRVTVTAWRDKWLLVFNSRNVRQSRTKVPQIAKFTYSYLLACSLFMVKSFGPSYKVCAVYLNYWYYHKHYTELYKVESFKTWYFKHGFKKGRT